MKRKEELTAKMHSEFSISPEEERKHRCWSCLTLLNGNLSDVSAVEHWAESYNVTVLELVDEWTEFNRMKNP